MPSEKTVPVKAPRKLIEVAFPLRPVNEASLKEKSNPFLKEHPRNLHLWWARRPLAAARAVLFCQSVNDPGYERHFGRGVNKAAAEAERTRLFDLITRLVQWENLNNEEVLEEARAEILKSWTETCELNASHANASTFFNPNHLPPFLDPFMGGGSIPLSAQQLGFTPTGSDLNPIPVLINKLLIDIPKRFQSTEAVAPVKGGQGPLPGHSPKSLGLVQDIEYFAAMIARKSRVKLESLYPSRAISAEDARDRPELAHLVGQEAPITTWFWTRTVRSPNPAFSHCHIPLTTTFLLSNKADKGAWIEPRVENGTIGFLVKTGEVPQSAAAGTKTGRGGNFKCILSGAPIEAAYIRQQGLTGGLGLRLMAIAIQDGPRKIFLSPTVTDEASALGATPEWIPEQQLPDDARAFTPIIYGFRTYASLFTNRQLIALTTLSDAIRECEPEIRDACVNAGWPDDDLGLENGGKGPQAYAEALMTYLAFAVSQYSRFLVSFASWNPENQNISHGFGRQAIPVSWDFPEANPFIGRLTFETAIGWITTPLKSLLSLGAQGDAEQKDARRLIVEGMGSVVSTDPPYYDNVPYAELADFFYIWIRRVLRDVYPRMLSTRATPKKDELVAAPHRQGGREASQLFFLDGMTDAMRAIASVSHPAFPVTLYYAFKQADVSGSDTTSTGWETFLEAVIAAGFNITGTWPLSTERAARKRGKNSNALSSSILLVCRVREIDAGVLSRRDFLRHLKLTLPDALIEMTRGGENSPVAPVDLSQAIIGPGIGIFSRYKAVLEADGTPMTVKTALQLINRFLADDDFDPETRFCLQWFETNYWKEGLYGQADVGARASGAGVDTIAHAGLLRSGGGKVRLLRPAELAEGWQPERRNQTPVWEGLHHLIHTLNTHGEQAAGALLAAMPAISGPARTLCYRLYTLCERQKLAEDARTYNELIGAWAAIEVAAQEHGYVETQTELF